MRLVAVVCRDRAYKQEIFHLPLSAPFEQMPSAITIDRKVLFSGSLTCGGGKMNHPHARIQVTLVAVRIKETSVQPCQILPGEPVLGFRFLPA